MEELNLSNSEFWYFHNWKAFVNMILLFAQIVTSFVFQSELSISSHNEKLMSKPVIFWGILSLSLLGINIIFLIYFWDLIKLVKI